MKNACSDPFNKEDIAITDSHVKFHIIRFLKAFIYHFLFILVLGPFVSPILILLENKNFVINMGFYKSTLNFWLQVIHWLSMVFAIITYFKYNKKNYLSTSELGMAILCTILRLMIVSFRYSTTT
jgi:hypothetical protein